MDYGWLGPVLGVADEAFSIVKGGSWLAEGTEVVTTSSTRVAWALKSAAVEGGGGGMR